MTSSEPSRSARLPLRIDRSGGEAGVLVPRWSGGSRRPRLVLSVLVSAAAAVVVAGVALGELGVVLLGSFLLAVTGGSLVWTVRRLPHDGGLWFRPSEVAHRWRGETWALAWENVAGVRVAPGTRDPVLSANDGDDRVVSSHLLVMSPETVAAAIELLAAQPGVRAELGTDAGLRRLEGLRDAMDADYRPRPRVESATRKPWLTAAVVVPLAMLLGLAVYGRMVTIDDDALAEDVAAALAEQGRPMADVTCHDALRKEVGESVDCTGTEDGQERRITVTVTAVDDQAVEYDIEVH